MPFQSENNHTDQRYFPRWETRNRIRYQLENDNISREGLTKDINCTGACLFIDQTPRIKDKINLTVYLSADTSISLKGHVVWVIKGIGDNQVGIHFYDTPQKTQDLILQHAFEFNKKGFNDYLFKGWEGNSKA